MNASRSITVPAYTFSQHCPAPSDTRIDPSNHRVTALNVESALTASIHDATNCSLLNLLTVGDSFRILEIDAAVVSGRRRRRLHSATKLVGRPQRRQPTRCRAS